MQDTFAKIQTAFEKQLISGFTIGLQGVLYRSGSHVCAGDRADHFKELVVA